MYHYLESERVCGRGVQLDRDTTEVCKAYQITDRALIYSVQPKLQNESHRNNII